MSSIPLDPPVPAPGYTPTSREYVHLSPPAAAPEFTPAPREEAHVSPHVAPEYAPPREQVHLAPEYAPPREHAHVAPHAVQDYTPPRREYAFTPPAEGARPVLNVLVAALGLVLAAPLMLLIAILVKLTSPGPILYKQTRVGLDRRDRFRPTGNARRQVDYGGRPFTIYKFRTMSAPPSKDAQAEVWARPDDPRVTPLGRVLRQYRLDELPQLWNVLRRDMNVVGPRPEQPTIFARLREEIVAYPERQRVHPGITGWAQINQRYDSSIDDVRRKLAYDLEYVQRATAVEDVRIMMRTLPVMLFRQGAC